MFKNIEIFFLAFLLLFLPLAVSAFADEANSLPPSMKEFVEDMQHQIDHWISRLEKMEKDPCLPAAKRAVIKALKDILINANKLLDELLPSEPKTKKTEGLKGLLV